MWRLVLGTAFTFAASAALAQDRLPVPPLEAVELWQRYCVSYSQDYREVANFFKSFAQYEETGPNWFADKRFAFDLGFHIRDESGTGDCVAVFLTSDTGLRETADILQRFIYAVDPSAFSNREGQYIFSLMAAQFTLIPTYSEDEQIVSLTLVRQ